MILGDGDDFPGVIPFCCPASGGISRAFPAISNENNVESKTKQSLTLAA